MKPSLSRSSPPSTSTTSTSVISRPGTRTSSRRSAGAAELSRRLGYGVLTFQSDPDKREDGRVVVIAVVTRSTPEEEERIRERGDLLMCEALDRLLG